MCHVNFVVKKKASYQCKEKLSSYHFCFQVKAGKKRKGICGKAKKQLKIDFKSAEVSCNEDYSNEEINSVIYKYPGFVVMPNCPRGNPSGPKDANIILKEDCENENAVMPNCSRRDSLAPKDANIILKEDCENENAVMPNCSRGDFLAPKDAKIILKEDCENENAFSKWWNTNVAIIKSNTHFDEKFFKYLVMR